MNPLLQLVIALGLGLLVGLQREWASSDVAGIRTFPLIAAFGALTGLLAEHAGGWAVAAGLLSVAAVMVVGNVAQFRKGEPEPGMTTEVAALAMFAVGAALAFGQTTLAIAAGGSVAVLLQWKRPLHRFAQNIGESDLRAVTKLVLIGLVILPILPNRTYGPYDVLNPFEIWLMVVLIVGISLGAYVVQRLLGARTGSILAGALGGMISSTAATISYAKESRTRDGVAGVTALIIVIAATVVFGRVLLEIAIVAPEIVATTAPPLAAMMLAMIAICLVAYVLVRSSITKVARAEAPTDLKAPIAFGLAYAVIIFLVAAAKERFGEGGMYVVATLSGLTDMDALTLSTAQLAKDGRLEPGIAWRLILVAAMSNIVFKGLAVAVIARAELFRRVATLFAAALVTGGAILWLW